MINVFIYAVIVWCANKLCFLHDRPRILPWMKSKSNELDITIHVIASQLSCHCDVISNWLWRHHQNENQASETRRRCVKIKSSFLSPFMDSLYRVRNEIVYVLSWRTVSALTRALFCFATWEINTKFTRSWALKQFVTRVLTLFFICWIAWAAVIVASLVLNNATKVIIAINTVW